jgi:hypothetical protein
METYKIVANVGIGQPANGELIFNFHFSTFIGVEWTSSFSYGQLCQMDNYVNSMTNKIRHVAFPVVSTSRQQRILQLTGTDNSYAYSLDASKVMIEKLRSMAQIWVAVLLMRLHAMPLAVQEKIESFFSLPYGPNPLDAHQASDQSHNHRPSPSKRQSIFGFTKSKEDKVDTYEKVIRTEDEAETSKPPMVRLSVVRGPEGRRGKQEYQVSRCECFDLVNIITVSVADINISQPQYCGQRSHNISKIQ